MKVRTFDLVNEGDIECELHYINENGLMMLRVSDGRKITRHKSKCSYDEAELQKWLEETGKKGT